MNEPHEDLLRQLERVTTNEEISPADMDGEKADLRESWLHLTRLLADADSYLDEIRRPNQVQQLPRSTTWKTVAVRALAVSLLVAITAVWLVAHDPAPHQPQVASPGQPSQHNLAGPAGNSAHDELAWSDDLDQQLDAAERALHRLQSPWSSQDMVFSVLQDRLDQLEAEMETGWGKGEMME